MSGGVRSQSFLADYKASYNSYSGVDMRVTFEGIEIGELQGVSFTCTREKAPLYTMGNPNPRAFSRGKRGIAGSLIFLVFDRDAFIGRMREGGKSGFKAWPSEVTNLLKAAADADRGDETFNPAGGISGIPGAPLPSQAIRDLMTRERVNRKAWYADQILPFDCVITAENEYGSSSFMAILGCEILNSGAGMSVDDITTDNNMTFIAREVIPWTVVSGTPDIDAVREFGRN